MFTHETTHVNDRMVYLGGSRHREGTDLEAFAQGMFSPSCNDQFRHVTSDHLDWCYTIDFHHLDVRRRLSSIKQIKI